MDSRHATSYLSKLLSVRTPKGHHYLAQIRDTGDLFEDVRHGLTFELRIERGQNQSDGLNPHEVAKACFQ